MTHEADEAAGGGGVLLVGRAPRGEGVARGKGRSWCGTAAGQSPVMSRARLTSSGSGGITMVSSLSV